MSIQAFIQQEILLPRLRRNGVLVVYDPAQRYRTLCLALASETLKVVDATESSIESRESSHPGLARFRAAQYIADRAPGVCAGPGATHR